jgi:negative regulator of replication initiation
MITSVSATVQSQCTLPNKLFQQGVVDGKEKNITVLQTILKTQGYLTQDPNGVFNVATKKAVTAFQKKNNLKATGITGPYTIVLLNKLGCQSKDEKIISSVGTSSVAKELASVPSSKSVNVDNSLASSSSETVDAKKIDEIRQKVGKMLKSIEEFRSKINTDKAGGVDTTSMEKDFTKIDSLMSEISTLVSGKQGNVSRSDLEKASENVKEVLVLLKGIMIQDVNMALNNPHTKTLGLSSVGLNTSALKISENTITTKLAKELDEKNFSQADKNILIQDLKDIIESRNNLLLSKESLEASDDFSETEYLYFVKNIYDYSAKSSAFFIDIQKLVKKYF